MNNLQRTAAIFAVLVLPWATGCFTLAGGAVGGTIGGGVGLIGGACTGQPVEGMTAGAAGGAVVGAATGAVVDVVVTAPLRIPGAVADAVRPKPGLDVDEVVDMFEAGVDPDTIVLQIRNEGMKKRLSSQDLMSLSRKNVPQEIILAMQANIAGETKPEDENGPNDPPTSSPLMRERMEQNAQRPFILPEPPSSRPDMTPAVSGGAFGPPFESIPGYDPTETEGGRWNFNDVPRTPGGARVQTSDSTSGTYVPNVASAPPEMRTPSYGPPQTDPPSAPLPEGTDESSSDVVPYDEIWRR